MDSSAVSADTTPDKAWTHPPITPFRLAFVFTTGGFGIAKAVLVSTGDSTSSTTIDWITGVVIALIFQFLGSYEYSSARSQKWDWFFSYNCLGTKARKGCADTCTVGPPISLSGEHLNSALPPFVTAYRLLVSGMFAFFGLTKMLLGYLGFSSTMNTLEWIVAIPLTLGIYYIGLYEEHKGESKALQKLFDVSYLSQSARVFKIVLYSSSIALCGYWIKLWSGGLRFIMQRTYDVASHNHDASSYWWEFAAWNPMFERSLDWMGVSFCVMMLEIGVLILGVIIWPLAEAYLGRHLRSIRFYANLGACITLYLLLAIYLGGNFLCVVSIAVPVCGLSFKPHAEADLSLPMRIVIPLAMIGGLPITGIPCVLCLFKVLKLLKELIK